MRENNTSCKKDLKDVSSKRIPKTIIRYAVVLLAVAVVLGYLPQVLLAAPIVGQIIEKRTEDIDIQAEPSSQQQVEESIAAKDGADYDHKGEGDTYTGVDMRNDPNFIAELKQLYREEDLNRLLYEPQRILTMPNLIGMTEAEAVRTMREAGLVPRIEYQDHLGAEEGICFAQDIPAGTTAYSNAGYFVLIQRSEKKIEDSKPKDELQKVPETVKPSEQIEQAKPLEQIEPTEPAGETAQPAN